MNEIYSSENVMRYSGSYPVNINDYPATLVLINHYEATYYNNEAIRWGIELKKENKLIGTCGFHNFNDKHYRCEIGYELNERYWRKGYMSEALIPIIDFAYEYLNINRIQALVYKDNKSSERLLKKLGFTHEGLLRKYAYFRNKFEDLNLFSLIKE
jgi:ribosomal-protein-alanine N-acetyltransferase